MFSVATSPKVLTRTLLEAPELSTTGRKPRSKKDVRHDAKDADDERGILYPFPLILMQQTQGSSEAPTESQPLPTTWSPHTNVSHIHYCTTP